MLDARLSLEESFVLNRIGGLYSALSLKTCVFPCHIEPIPALLQGVVDHLIQWHIISDNKRPNGCIINFFDEVYFFALYHNFVLIICQSAVVNWLCQKRKLQSLSNNPCCEAALSRYQF